MAANSIDLRIQALEKDIESLSASSLDDAHRKRLFEITSRASTKLESPADFIWRIFMSPHAPAALMVIIQMGIVNDLVRSECPKTAKELSESCGGDELLIVRMMRPLVALGIFNETKVQTYESTPISRTLMEPSLMGGYQFMFEFTARSLTNLPRYLAKTGYENPTGPSGAFQDCNQTTDSMFQYLMKHPVMMNNFNDFMSGSLQTRPDWHQIFDVNGILLDGAKKDDPDAVLIVDVGGGEGHDTASFHQAFPNAPGKLILQDLPQVIENIKELDSAIIRQKHDFFASQPVEGARAYYFRHILHDWHDEACVTILRQTAAVMTREYSKLLIFEFLLPAKDVPLYPALLDINMMALLNGMERTEAQWTALLAEAGFKVIRFHRNHDDAEGLIEAELV